MAFKKRFKKRMRRMKGKRVAKIARRVAKNVLHKQLENKFFANTNSSQPDWNGLTQTNLMTNIVQGLTDQTRIGIKIRPIKLKYQFQVQGNPLNVNPETVVRIIVFRLTDENGILPGPGAFFLPGSIAGSNVNNAIYDPRIESNYDILWDKKFVVANVSSTLSTPASGSPYYRTFNKTLFGKKLQKKITYIAGAGAQAPQNGGIYITMLSNAVTNPPTILWSQILFYEDG